MYSTCAIVHSSCTLHDVHTHYIMYMYMYVHLQQFMYMYIVCNYMLNAGLAGVLLAN